MRRRVRWYDLDLLGAPVSRLAEMMIADEYNDDDGAGFVIENASKSMVSGSFIERIDIEDVVSDPHGNMLKFSRVEFRQIEFKILSGRPSLELIDPPRTCKPFFHKLERMLDYRVALSPVAPDLRKWLKALESLVGKVTVTSIAVSGVSMSGRVSADVMLSGSDDVRKELVKLLGDRHGEVVEVSAAWQKSDMELQCDLMKGGANYDSSVERHVAPVLRATLQDSLAGSPRGAAVRQ